MMELFEDYKNLNMIDRTLLIGNNYKNEEIKLQDLPITPNSEIYIDKVSPHNFTKVMEILDSDESIGAIVVRAHNRQLLMVTKDRQIIRRLNLGYDNYGLILTKFAYSNYNNHYTSRFIHSDREAPIKTAISRTVKAFYEKAPEGTKKKWDILVIKKDPNVAQQREDRKTAQAGRVLVPSDKNYDDFIKQLNWNFGQRVEKYINSKRINTNNIEEIGEYLMNSSKLDKIKVKGVTYVKTDAEFNVGNKDRLSYILYASDELKSAGENKYRLYVFFRFDGFKPVFVKAVPADGWTSSRNASYDIGNSSVSF